MNVNHTNDALYPISAVSQMTGVNAVTLRAWERRYGLLKPTRTEAGHRLFSESDVDHIKNILQLLDDGIAISRVTSVLQQAADQPEVIAAGDSGPWMKYQSSMIQAVQDFNEATLENVYNEAMSLYPVDVVTGQLLMPLMKRLGERWMQESAGIAEEHFLSVFLRNKLGARFNHRNLQNDGHRIVAACLPGEQHEFGLLLFALSAHARGYRIILLGANMPIAQLAEVVTRTNSDAIVLSGSITSDLDDFDEELSTLVRSCKVPVFIGGTVASQRRQLFEHLGAIPVGDDLIVGMHAINKKLPR